jgi:hypothetical protein
MHLELPDRYLDREYGWITLAVKDEPNVLRQMSRLPGHVRHQHMLCWNRRAAIDSQRERERALIFGQDREGESKLIKSHPISVGPPLQRSQGMASPRAAYVTDAGSDPKGIGFGYGGVYPGRLHAKGQIYDTHEVQFSIGASGKYLMYIGLRQPSTDASNSTPANVPGSPFLVHVSPGAAHPLGTSVPIVSLPLIGSMGKSGKQFIGGVTIAARDKMGNRCPTGGADISCGYLDGASSVGLNPDEPDETELIASNGQSASVVDNGDGTYACSWFSEIPGEFTVYVKMDGIHLINSPMELKFLQQGLETGS